MGKKEQKPQKPVMHVLPPEIAESPLRTTIAVIGAGGTGTHVIEGLAMMNEALIALGYNGLSVQVFDDDIVLEHNIGRQSFGWNDCQKNKAEACVARVNRMYGTDWIAQPIRFDPGKFINGMSNIVITAVDNGKTRNQVYEWFKRNAGWRVVNEIETGRRRPHHHHAFETHYWLDIGNDDRYGQFLLASEDLPSSVDLFGKFSEEPVKASCSAAESLRRQDLFINKLLATHACNLLWELLRKTRITHHGGYLNLATGKLRPIKVPFKPPIDIPELP